jgi:hypothetical protein
LVSILSIIVLHRELILFGVNAKALGDKINVDTFDVLK